MEQVRKIAILTSGGDAPGMNPCIRAVVRSATAKGISVIGVRRGFSGLINGDVYEMTRNEVSGISRRGGTILYTARSEEFRTPAGVERAVNTCKYLGIDGVIAMGGDGTFRGCLELARHGIRVVGVPATIDNDMGCTNYTIGFDTACNTAIEAVDKLGDTGQSHERVSVVEVMGRNAGHLALYIAVAVGATVALIPEKPYEPMRDIIEPIRTGCLYGRRHHIVIVAEGVQHATEVMKIIQDETGIETRLTVLGHIQRGGAPTARDRAMAAMMGVHAVDVISSNPASRVVVTQGANIVDLDMEEALTMSKGINEFMFKTFNRIDTAFINR